MLTAMKTRESKKVLLAETDNTTELSQGVTQCNLSSELTQQMDNFIIDDTASRFQVPPPPPPPKQHFSTPTKKINCTRYLLTNIIMEKLKLDTTSGDRTSLRWCAPNQYGPTRNLRLYCLK